MVLKDYYNTGDDSTAGFYGVTWEAMTFTPSTTYTITSIKVLIYRTGSPGTLTARIRATSSDKPTGADLCSGTIDGDSITTSTAGDWYEITLGAGTSLTSATKYSIILDCSSGDSSNKITWRVDASSPTYTGGNLCESGNSGSTWASGTQDCMFETYDSTTTNYSKKVMGITSSATTKFLGVTLTSTSKVNGV